MARWNEPGLAYWNAAIEELGVDPGDLEELSVEETSSVPIGQHALMDAVYTKAWELREAEE